MPENSEFIFRLEGVNLSAKDEDRIAQVIRSAVHAELGNRKTSAAVFVNPLKWKGGLFAILKKGVVPEAKINELQKKQFKVVEG